MPDFYAAVIKGTGSSPEDAALRCDKDTLHTCRSAPGAAQQAGWLLFPSMHVGPEELCDGLSEGVV